ncbi:MAG: hypothetical protein ACLP50_37555 [Solirubrobacteraceae bacterium]
MIDLFSGALVAGKIVTPDQARRWSLPARDADLPAWSGFAIVR